MDVLEIQNKLSKINETVAIDTALQKKYREIVEILHALERTPTMNDPGKYGMAAWYISPDRKLSSEDSEYLDTKCLLCDRRAHVIITYDQIWDSWDGDTWLTRSLTICANDHLCIREKAYSSMRGIELEKVLRFLSP